MEPLLRPPRRSQITLTTIFTVCFGVLVVVGAVLFVVNTLVALTLTVSALMIAVALDHVVSLLVKRGVRRSHAIALVAATAVALTAGVTSSIIPPLVAQGKQLGQRVPEMLSHVRATHFFQTIDTHFNVSTRLIQLERRLPELLSGAAGPLLSLVGSVVNALGAAVTIFFLAIFMLVFGGRLVRNLLAEATPERRGRYEKMVEKIYRLIGGYLGGLILICTINATMATTFLAIVRIPFFLPLGLISGFSSLVPYAGPLVAGATVSVLTAVTGGLWKGVACAIYFVLYGQLEGNVFGPLIFRRTVHVNPLIVLLSLLFFGEIAGVIGAVLAVPVTAALQILVREMLRVRREQLHLAHTPLNTPTDST